MEHLWKEFTYPLVPCIGLLPSSSTTSIDSMLVKANTYLKTIPSPNPHQFLFKTLLLGNTWTFKKRSATSSGALSLTNPSSPLFPDGIFTPLWIEKHLNSVPSVVVGFYTLIESYKERPRELNKSKTTFTQDGKRDPLGVGVSGVGETSTEREKDMSICSDINEKKRNGNEVGVKYFVILVIPKSSSEAVVEERIQYIKRSCALDKSNLFIIYESWNEEEFKKLFLNMSKILLEASFYYYKEREKKIKKKRSKVGNKGATNNPQAWLIRYDIKMGIYAECRQDKESGLRYYESAYQNLGTWLKSCCASSLVPGGGLTAPMTESIPPYSSRWDEAKHLLNALSYKICVTSLASQNTLTTCFQFHRHLGICKSFPEFAWSSPSSMDNIPLESIELTRLASLVPGRGSFEYWAFVSHQYQLLGELIEMASTLSHITLPWPPIGSIPVTVPSSNVSSVVVEGQGLFGPYSGMNMSIYVQNGGIFYWMSALACQQTRVLYEFVSTRFEMTASVSPSLPLVQYQSAIIKRESQVNHSLHELKLLDSACVIFKKKNYKNWILSMNMYKARVYIRLNDYESALSLYTEVALVYRQDGFQLLLFDCLRCILECSRVLKRVDVYISTIMELLSLCMSEESLSMEDLGLGLKEMEWYFELFCQSLVVKDLANTSPTSPISLKAQKQVQELSSISTSNEMMKFSLPSCPFIQCKASWEKGNSFIYQVELNFDSRLLFSRNLDFIVFEFSNSLYNLTIYDSYARDSSHTETTETTHEETARQLVYKKENNKDPLYFYSLFNNSSKQVFTNLSIDPKIKKYVFQGQIKGLVGTVELNRILVGFKSCFYSCQVDLSPIPASVYDSKDLLWIHLDSEFQEYSLEKQEIQLTVQQLQIQPKLEIEFQSFKIGILNSKFPVKLQLKNLDHSDVYIGLEIESVNGDVFLDVSGDFTSAKNKYKHVIKSISSSSCIDLDFYCKGLSSPGVKSLSLSLYYCFTSVYNSFESSQEHGELWKECFQLQKSHSFDLVEPLSVAFDLTRQPSHSLDKFDPVGLFSNPNGPLEKHQVWTLSIRIENICPFALTLKNLDIQGYDSAQVQVLALKEFEQLNLEPNESFVCIYNLNVSYSPLSSNLINIGSLHLENLNLQLNEWSFHSFTLPSLNCCCLPLVMSMDVPQEARVGQVLPVTFTIENSTLDLYELTLSMESSDSFVYSGFKSCKVRVLPLGLVRFVYRFIPLTSGKVMVPRLVLVKDEMEVKDVEWVGDGLLFVGPEFCL